METLTPLEHPYPHRMFFWPVGVNQAATGARLRIRGVEYEHGLGMRTPCNARYHLRPEYQRFVGLAGVDDGLVGEDYGALIAGKPALVFQVFIDGELAAGSPVLRISQEPWRFDVPIPPHSRQINLVATSRGENYPYSLGNWVEAGFITGTDY